MSSGPLRSQPSSSHPDDTARAEYTITGPEADGNGILTFCLATPYQPDRQKTRIRILPPKSVDPNTLRILYVLPVEPGMGRTWGDPVEAIRRNDLHNRFGFVVVYPTFAQMPWYADHPTDPNIRQETYMLKAVVPAVDRLYPTKPGRRALLGFSKSGNGAFTLLLRNPDTFAVAAAWDAPLMQASPNAYEMGRIYGTQENYNRYRVPDLLKQQADLLKKSKPRLALSGYDSFRTHVQQAHELMSSLGIEHLYADGPRVRHHWNSGWIDWSVEAIDKMMK